MKINNPLFILGFLIIACACNNQQKESPTTNTTLPDSNTTTQNTPTPVHLIVDVSPMDMSYFPVDYPKIKMTNSNVAPPVMRVIYSRPHLENRHLFKDLLKYNEPWRLGANESTEIEFYKSVSIQGKKIVPGRYILYCIPQPQSWTIVLNSNVDTWGLHQDTAKDLQKFDIPVITDNPMQEYFTMVFEKTNKGADLIISWENLLARLPVEF